MFAVAVAVALIGQETSSAKVPDPNYRPAVGDRVVTHAPPGMAWKDPEKPGDRVPITVPMFRYDFRQMLAAGDREGLAIAVKEGKVGTRPVGRSVLILDLDGESRGDARTAEARLLDEPRKGEVLVIPTLYLTRMIDPPPPPPPAKAPARKKRR